MIETDGNTKKKKKPVCIPHFFFFFATKQDIICRVQLLDNRWAKLLLSVLYLRSIARDSLEVTPVAFSKTFP